MMKYDVGQYVRVKTNLKGHEHYGGTYFNPDMEKYRGKVFKILSKDTDSRRYTLKALQYTLGDRRIYWHFSDEMLDPVLEPHKTNMSSEEADKLISRSDSIFDMLAK